MKNKVLTPKLFFMSWVYWICFLLPCCALERWFWMAWGGEDSPLWRSVTTGLTDFPSSAIGRIDCTMNQGNGFVGLLGSHVVFLWFGSLEPHTEKIVMKINSECVASGRERVMRVVCGCKFSASKRGILVYPVVETCQNVIFFLSCFWFLIKTSWFLDNTTLICKWHQ